MFDEQKLHELISNEAKSIWIQNGSPNDRDEIIWLQAEIKIFYKISHSQNLSESFIEKFQDKVNWRYISQYQTLSESFIEKFQDKVNWINISYSQNLSEPFIEKFQDKVDWINISYSQNLSEPFIEKFQDKVNWLGISHSQNLSEPFIEKFQHKVNWRNISFYQTLSESFIEKFQDKVNWMNISSNQVLSESFIEKFQDKVDRNSIRSNPSNSQKLNYLKQYTNYEIVDDTYIFAFKSLRRNMSSLFKPGLVYEIGKTYYSSCDCDELNENSFGLSAWTLKGAKDYYNKGVIVRVKIHIDDLGAVVLQGDKLRCRKLQILEVI